VLDVPTVLPNLSLTAEVRHNLLLAAREALQNVVAHAAASEVQVKLHLTEKSLRITIADDGKGFDPQQVSCEGNGLPNMKKRLEDIGGRIQVTSRTGVGTVVEFQVPDQRLHARVIGATAAPL
jgi:signal transduction histidine kinase